MPTPRLERVTPARRSLMRRVRREHTRPEMTLRLRLHALGYRYRLHRRDLPGRPDLAFPSRRAAIFVNGCFWHGHHCRAGREPGTRQEFWKPKLQRNRERDAEKIAALEALGWRALTVWECELRALDAAVARARAFLDG